MIAAASENRRARASSLRIAILTQFVCAIAGLLAMTLPCWAARGEVSYTLAETVEAVPAGVGVVQSSIWDRSADQTFGSHDVLAIGNGTVAFAAGGRLCGYAEADGHRRWCVAGGTGPAYASGQVAFALHAGGSASVDARDGQTRWRHGGRVGFEEVWPAGTDFLIRDSRGVASEVTSSGKSLWSADVADSNNNPFVVEPYAFFPIVSDGAYLSMNQQVVRLGRAGGAADTSFTSWEIAAVDLPYAFITLDPIEETEDHYFTVNVGRVDVRTGNVDRQFHFEPDYDVNSASFYKTGMVEGGSDTSQAPLRFDGDLFYATVAHNVYRYLFAEPALQHPLLVARDARLLGGPYHGAIFVRRRDGVWLLRPDDRAIRARLVTRSAADVANFSIVGNSAYVAFADGSVRGFDALSGRPLLAVKPCDPTSNVRVGVGSSNVYVVCPSHGYQHLFAFHRRVHEP